MKILIVDLECTCWTTPLDQAGEQEIIEVGLAMYDADTKEVSRLPECLVKPSRSTISKFCTALTTLTPDKVRNASEWEETVIKLYERYIRFSWASFGNFDCSMLERQSKLFKTISPFSHQHLNVKALASIKLNKRIRSMSHAMRVLDLTSTGIAHRGNDDAFNIGHILKELLK